MPRYCAVKVCRNRGGNSSKRENNKRISFYPFPLQDTVKLQRWMDNMKQKEWTPSRHQYLCSEHFTEDCFDIRWGIRYLKNTAIPTIFSSIQNEEGKRKLTTTKINTKICDVDRQPTSASPLGKRPLILTRTTKASQSTCANSKALSEDGSTTDSVHPDLVELPVAPSPSAGPCSVSPDGASPSEFPADALGPPGQSRGPPARYLTLPHEGELRRQGDDSDSVVTVLRCESLDLLSDGEEACSGTGAEHPRACSLVVPVEVIGASSVGGLDHGAPWEGDQISADEHSYCRARTEKEQLWGRILSLHTKMVELDRREEVTVARIHALERELASMKRDGAAFEEKQKSLEDCISSILH